MKQHNTTRRWWQATLLASTLTTTVWAGTGVTDPDAGLVILKTIHEDGEDLLSTLDSDEELEAVYEQFMELLFSDEEE